MIPEPTTELWLWVRRVSDSLFPQADEDAAERMGNAWDEAARALTTTIDQANRGIGSLPGIWRDVPGILYHRNADQLVNGGGGQGGYNDLAAMMQEMALLSHNYAEQIQHVKNQIYAELTANALVFAWTFAMPPGFGDFFRARIVTGIVARLSTMIRSAAGLLEHASAGLRAGLARLARLGGEPLLQSGEEAGIERYAQWLGKTFGYRENYDTRQVLINAGAGALGVGIALPLSPLGKVASIPASRLASSVGLSGAALKAVDQGAHAFVVNGLSSPIAGTAAQAIADGKLTELGLGDYLSAIRDQAIGAGVLATSRVGTVHLATAGRAWIGAVQGHSGVDPGAVVGPQPADPAGPQPPATAEPPSVGQPTPAGTPAGGGPASAGDSGSTGSVPGGNGGPASAGSGPSGGTGGVTGQSGTSGQDAVHPGGSPTGHQAGSTPDGGTRAPADPATQQSSPASQVDNSGSDAQGNLLPDAGHGGHANGAGAAGDGGTDGTGAGATARPPMSAAAAPHPVGPGAGPAPAAAPGHVQPTTVSGEPTAAIGPGHTAAAGPGPQGPQPVTQASTGSPAGTPGSGPTGSQQATGPAGSPQAAVSGHAAGQQGGADAAQRSVGSTAQSSGSAPDSRARPVAAGKPPADESAKSSAAEKPSNVEESAPPSGLSAEEQTAQGPEVTYAVQGGAVVLAAAQPSANESEPAAPKATRPAHTSSSDAPAPAETSVLRDAAADRVAFDRGAIVRALNPDPVELGHPAAAPRLVAEPDPVGLAVAEALPVVVPGAIPLQDGGFRAIGPGARQVTVPGSAIDDLVSRLTQQAADGIRSEQLRAEAVEQLAEELTRLSGQEAASQDPAAPTSPEDVLRAAAHRVTANEIARGAQQLSPDQTTTTQTSTVGQTNPTGQSGSSDGDARPGDTLHAPEVPGTRFVGTGRPAGALTADEAMAAIAETREADFGGAVVGTPQASAVDVVVVDAPSAGPQHFRVEVGPVPRGRLAATTVAAGTAADPHVVRLATGIAADQLARVWVHEISHTLQGLTTPPQGVVRRLWSRMTGSGQDACVDAQFNEYRLLGRQWAEAAEQADRTGLPQDREQEEAMRRDIEGLAEAIGRRGHTPPAHPWDAPILPTAAPTPLADLKASIDGQLQSFNEVVAGLQARIDAKRHHADEAFKAEQQARQTAAKEEDAKDSGRFARSREALADAETEADLARWHQQVADSYQAALDHAEAARAGYAQLLAEADTRTPDQLAAAADILAAHVTAYEQAMTEIAPPAIVLPSLLPTGRLPHLTALAERINDVLVASGIDHAFTAEGLQHRLSAEFGQLVTDQGAVLRVGRAKVADLRVRLTASELVEVLNPPVKASETMIGLMAQAGRRLATIATSRTGASGGISLGTIARLFGENSWAHGLGEFVTLRTEVSTGRSRAVTTNAAEFAQDGAVEDNRGESLLFTGKASWQLEVRPDGSDDWTAVGQVSAGNPRDTGELRAWVSHAYTVGATERLVQRADFASSPPGQLPAHVLTSISGLQALSDQALARFDSEVRRFGSASRLVRDQIHAALTEDLPGRLAESTGRAVLRPILAGGRPIGHLQVETTVRYEKVELVGAQSTAHWQERVRVGMSAASGQQGFGATASVSSTVGYGGEQLTDLNDSGVSLGPTVAGGRSVSRSESSSGGGTAVHVGVQRYTGPTQAYRAVLEHKVTLVLNGKAVGTVVGDSEALMRMQVNDAYRHGFPVDVAALALDDQGRPLIEGGRPVLNGDVRTGVDVPGRKLELPTWAGSVVGGQVPGSGPWTVQAVTGGEQALTAIVDHLDARGFLPPLDAAGNPDLSRLSPDPLERHGQLLNLAEIRAQLSGYRLEAGYDIAAQAGILVTLTRPRTGLPTETVTLRIGIDQGTARPLGVTTDEAVVTLNIGSDTSGRSGSRTKGLPWTVNPLGISGKPEGPGPGLGGKAGVSYGRQSLGRAISWFTGGTVNQVTLVESSSPVAVFEIPHLLVVTELTEDGQKSVHEGTKGTSARVLMDSDLLPYDDAALAPGPPSGPVAAKVLDRATILALDASRLLDGLSDSVKSDVTALRHLAAFLNPRNLIAHPEWSHGVFRTAAVVQGQGVASRRSTVSLTGEVRDAELVAVTDGVAGDINLALSNHGTSAGRSTGHNTGLSAGAAEVDGASRGGGINGSISGSSSTSRTDQSIWGVERLTIEVGRHYVFTAAVDFGLAVGNSAPENIEAATVFQVPERDALVFYNKGELSLPLHQVADAVERYVNDKLSLDRSVAVPLIRRYRAAVQAAETAGTPLPRLASAHTAEVLAEKLRMPSPHPLPQAPEERLAHVLARAEELAETPRRVALPAQYERSLGASLVESVELTDGQNPVRLLEQVKSLLQGQLGVGVEQDPVLAESLFADLAGKRWWGRLDDMLNPGGFVRSYPVGRVGSVTAERVTVRVRASFADEAAESLGETSDAISIVQRYLYDEHSQSWSTGRSTGVGADGTVDDGHAGSLGTDRSGSVSGTEGEQTTRLERIATFDGLGRIRRGLRLSVEISHEPIGGGPARGLVGRMVAPKDAVAHARAELNGDLVQLVPIAQVGRPGSASASASGAGWTGRSPARCLAQRLLRRWHRAVRSRRPGS